MPEENSLITERKEKRAALLDKKLAPYARGFVRNITAEKARELPAEKIGEVEMITNSPQDSSRLSGRLMTFREHGKISFGQLQDISGKIQICFLRGFTRIAGLATEDETEHEHFWKKSLDLGDFIGVTGDFFQTKHGEITLLVHELELLSKVLRPLPEKWHGLSDRETCYRERYLDLLTNPETFRRFQIRSQVISTVRQFLENMQFQEVETRMLQPQAGGAMAKVFRTHHNALDQEFVLRIALELDLKMLVAGGMERVYEIGKCFRNEGMDPSHLQEFTMLEWYAAYATLDDNMNWTEEMLKTVLQKVVGGTKIMLRNKENIMTEVDFGGEWKRARFPDLLKEYADIDMFVADLAEVQKKAQSLGLPEREMKNMSRGNLLDFIYKKSARPQLLHPTFVLDYPSELKPLARPKGDGTAECYQLLVAGWEIVNSYGELVDPVIQRELLEAQARAKAAGDEETMDVDEEFLKAMEHGMPPMTGFGMGIDRLVTLLTGQENLRDVVLFPLMKPEKNALSLKEKEALYRSKKTVVIAHEDMPAGVIANAIGQLGISIGGHIGENLFETKVLHDAEGRTHYTDALYPMVNYAGSGAQLAEFAERCYAAGIQFFDFSDIMRKAHRDDEMLKGYKEKKTSEIGYLAVGALVPADFAKEFLETLSLFGGEKK